MRIRSDILRTYQSIHTWTGIITGLVLFIAFFAGSLTMFKPQIEQWATPPLQQLAPISSTQRDDLIKQAITQYDKATDGFIVNFDAQRSPLTWYEKGGGRGFQARRQLKACNA